MYKSLEPVSFAKHGRLKFIQSKSFAFASGLMLSDLVAAELAHASLHFPLAFTVREEQAGLAALLSVVPGRNLFVAPNGSWMGGYIPAALRAYPFLGGGQNGEGQALLFVDTGSGLLSEKQGQALFTEEGTPSEMLQKIIGFLAEIEKNRTATNAACTALHGLKLLVPWEIKIAAEAGTTALTGLYRVDETTLNALSPEDFLSLRTVGALPLAYAQLLSMGRLEALTNLARQHVQSAAKGKKLLGDCFNLGKAEGNSFKF